MNYDNRLLTFWYSLIHLYYKIYLDNLYLDKNNQRKNGFTLFIKEFRTTNTGVVADLVFHMSNNTNNSKLVAKLVSMVITTKGFNRKIMDGIIGLTGFIVLNTNPNKSKTVGELAKEII